MKRAGLTAEVLRTLLSYDPETGVFTRRVVTASRVHLGDVAGWEDKDGYVNISLLNLTWKAHRLAWFYMTGEWPKADIDHKNLTHNDNRWDNLREATRTQNLANSGKRPSNTSGLKGVSKTGRKWRANMSIDDRQVYLGSFDCKAAAHFAYIVASHSRHGEFARSA